MIFFPENLDDWRRIRFLLEKAEKVFITSHVNPDGDAIGSETALANFVRAMGKPVRIINHAQTPESFTFLDTGGMIEMFREEMLYTIGPRQSDVVFFLDLGRYERAGDAARYLAETRAPKVIIDHHPRETADADVTVVNTQAASTGSLIFDLMCHIDASLITRDAALSIMTAVVTDTGYFRYSNTTATTHLIAAALYRYGVGAIEVRRHLETGYPLCRQKLLGLALGSVKLNETGEIACAHLTTSMFEKAGARREHTDGIIEQIRYINDIKVAALIIQEGKSSFKVSLRSSDGTTINKIAAALGGGGHPRAAGANVTGTLEEVTRRVLETAEKYLAETGRTQE